MSSLNGTEGLVVNDNNTIKRITTQDIANLSGGGTGISPAQSAAIVVNSAKAGITPAQSSAIVANSAKVSNVTHSGDVVGSSGLTIQPEAISNKPAKAVTGAEEVLINDAGTLRKTTAQNIADLKVALTELKSDLTPQLGGDLDVNGRKIVSANNGNVVINPHGTGNVGIGTNAPDTKLTVETASVIYAKFRGSARELTIGHDPIRNWITEVKSNGRLNIIAGNAGNDQIFLKASIIYPTGQFVITRTGDTTSTATQKGSKAIALQSSLWPGTAPRILHISGFKTIASTTENLADRIAIVSGGTLANLSNGTEKVSILSSGNVGVGITTPQAKLDVNGAMSLRAMAIPPDPTIQSALLYQDNVTSNLMCKLSNGTTTSIKTLATFV